MPRARGCRTGAALLALACTASVAGCSGFAPSRAADPWAAAPPVASRPWVPDAAGLGRGADGATNAAGVGVPLLSSADLQRTYDLPALIDLAQRNNPQTRIAWQQARAAAAGLGLAEADYFPVLAAEAMLQTNRATYPAETYPLNLQTAYQATPTLSLTYTLLDFGRRDAAVEGAAELVRAASLRFNRTHQDVAFAVQRAYFAYDAARAGLEAALASLRSAEAVEDAAAARLQQGLDDRTAALLGRQERIHRQFDVQTSRRAIAETAADLAFAVGLPASSAQLPVADVSRLPLPPALARSMDAVIDDALARRPDIAAQVAELRSRDADVRRAETAFLPTLALRGGYTQAIGSTKNVGQGPRSGYYDYNEPNYQAGVVLTWEVFEGFARENALRRTKARRDQAAAEIEQLRLATARDVVKAYAGTQTALAQYEFALSLLATSEEAYASALTGYREDLNSILDLLAAERDLARARAALVASRADLLTSAAALAWSAGEL